MAKTSPAEFARQVRDETKRVTWPSRKETTTTTLLVFVMAFVAAIFFFSVDQLLSTVVRWFLSLGA